MRFKSAFLVIATTILTSQLFAQYAERPKLVLQPKASLVTEPGQWSIAPLVPPPITRKDQRRLIVNWQIIEMKAEIAPGVTYDDYWAFEGHVPGPILRVREGDLVEVHLTNNIKSMRSHNIDFHFVSGPGGGASSLNVAPGETQVLEARAMVPGFYMFHCASPDIPTHISNGMYGFVIVEPAEGLPPTGREYYMVQSEIYTQNGNKGNQTFSMERGERADAQYVVFNGAVGSTMGSHALQANSGETVRLWVGNAGPNYISSFHVIGQIFSNVYREGDLLSPPAHGVQTTLIPAGGSSVVEFSTSVPGTYLAVDHAIFRLHKGAAASIAVKGPGAPEIFDPVTAGSKAMNMSDKDHVAGPPAASPSAEPAHAHSQVTQDSSPAPAAHTPKSNPRKISSSVGLQTGKSMGRYGLPSSISAANLPDKPRPVQKALPVVSGKVTVNILAGAAEYSTDPTHSFSKPNLAIKAGSTVTFLNSDEVAHYQKDDKGEFLTPVLRAGMSYSHTFRKPGTYHYECIPHPWMKGTIIVK
jgi:copper-containing nitrite reductase